MDTSDLLIAEADKLLEQSSERLKQVKSSSDLPISSKDALLLKCKDAIEQLNLEIEEEKQVRQELEIVTQQLGIRLAEAEGEIQRLRTVLAANAEDLVKQKTEFEETVRKTAKKREEEIRDQCAKREALMKRELKDIIEQLEQDLDASSTQHEQLQTANLQLTQEVSTLRNLLKSTEQTAEKSLVPDQKSDVLEQVTAKLTREMQKRLQDKADFKALLAQDKAAFKAKIGDKDRVIQTLTEECKQVSEKENSVKSAQQIIALTSQVKEERLKRLKIEREMLVFPI